MPLGNLLSRRSVLRAVAGIGTVAGAALPISGRALAEPMVVSGVTTLTFIPNWSDWGPAGRQLLGQAVARFSEAPGRKGLRLVPVQSPGTAAVIEAILGGTGPDVTNDCCRTWASYLGVGAFADLTPYLRRDGVPLSTWSSALVSGMAVGEQQLGLPVFDAPYVYAYRQDILDTLGLPYPTPEWTYAEAAALWRQCAGALPGGKGGWRYGANVQWYPWWNGTGYWFVAFHGAEMDASQTRCLVAEAGSIAAAEWLFGLVWDKVVTYPADAGGPASLVAGTAVFSIRGGWQVLTDVEQYGTRFKWDYLPVPRFPAGQATMDTFNFWGMNVYGKHPEASWELIKWLTVENYWQEFVMRTTLQTPAKVSLWDRWERYWTESAPLLRTKQIAWIKEAALGGYAYPEQFFRYQPLQADGILGAAMASIWNKKASVRATLSSAAAQINALEAAGAREQRVESQALAQTSALLAEGRAHPGSTVFPSPPRVGPAGGKEPAAAGALVRVTSGTVSLTASGTGVAKVHDSCTFAGAAFTGATGTFTCRLVAVVQPTAGKVAPGVKVGLMARASLSSYAASVAVAFSTERGIHAWSRPTDGLALGDERPTAPTAAAGLVGVDVLQVARPAVGGNWLTKPIWLRLVRNVSTWSVYTSWDGVNWTAAGIPQVVECAGIWVGLFAANHYGGVPLEATFDHLTGFAPSVAVRIGQG